MRPRKLLLIVFPTLIFLLVASFHRHVNRDFPHSQPGPLTASLPQLKYARALSEGFRPALKSAPAESVLFPDWEVFVLLPPNLTPAAGNLTAFHCLFHNNATSAAKYAGRIPSSNRHAFSCEMPASVQRLRPFYTPRLIGPDSGAADPIIGSVEMIRYERFAYDSLSTAADVIVFAKGVNRNQGKDRPAHDVTCVFTVSGAIYAVTKATVSAQEVFRCPHPSLENLLLLASDDVRVSIRIAGERFPIPSLAAYHPPAHDSGTNEKSQTCACTMVRNAGKFLSEWVAYHSAIGIERFFLYDNGSEDDLESVVRQLNDDEGEGYDVSSVYWPWPKTQEAGFSHCVAAHQDSCTWMAFIDVDEFIYSPSWSGRNEPEKSMIRSSFLPDEPNRVGQVQIGCVDFGPSGLKSQPKEGVTQGYTCRWSPPKNNNSNSNSNKKKKRSNMVRHKSIVRLGAVSESLKTVVHHFEMGSGWEVRKVGMMEGVVNHYKYQAWSEFRVKFRRRVSTFVADWGEGRNLGSKDRTPGLGRKAVKPDWWDRRECDGRDTRLRDLVRKWFLEPSGQFAWEQ